MTDLCGSHVVGIVGILATAAVMWGIMHYATVGGDQAKEVELARYAHGYCQAVHLGGPQVTWERCR